MHFISAVRGVSPEGEGDLPEVAQRVRQVFASDLEPHFQEEERFALPMLREYGHADLADEVYAQHERMREMDRTLGQSPSTELLVEFVHLLEKHVDYEENQVWEVLDAVLETRQAVSAASA